MSNPPDKSCSLCSGQGCLAQLFGAKGEGKPLPTWVMAVIYGLPLMLLLIGAYIGAGHSELGSILGAAGGPVIAFFILRSCQKRLNGLCLAKLFRSGDHSS